MHMCVCVCVYIDGSKWMFFPRLSLVLGFMCVHIKCIEKSRAAKRRETPWSTLRAKTKIFTEHKAQNSLLHYSLFLCGHFCWFLHIRSRYKYFSFESKVLPKCWCFTRGWTCALRYSGVQNKKVDGVYLYNAFLVFWLTKGLYNTGQHSPIAALWHADQSYWRSNHQPSHKMVSSSTSWAKAAPK